MKKWCIVFTDHDNAHEPKVVIIIANDNNMAVRGGLQLLGYEKTEIDQIISGEYTDDDFEESMEQKTYTAFKIKDTQEPQVLNT